MDVIVIGSAIVSDWWPGVSDIDLVLLLGRSLTELELSAVGKLHADSAGDGPIDGIYLTEEQLLNGPASISSATQVVEGKLLQGESGAQLTWVTWREIEHGVEGSATANGISEWRPSRRRFAGADDGVRSFSRANLREYWARLGADSHQRLADREEDAVVEATAVRWMALGPARLVATIETGKIISKSAAAAYAAERWPEHAELLHRAAASRSGSSLGFTTGDAREAISLLEKCVDHSWGA